MFFPLRFDFDWQVGAYWAINRRLPNNVLLPGYALYLRPKMCHLFAKYKNINVVYDEIRLTLLNARIYRLQENELSSLVQKVLSVLHGIQSSMALLSSFVKKLNSTNLTKIIDSCTEMETLDWRSELYAISE